MTLDSTQTPVLTKELRPIASFNPQHRELTQLIQSVKHEQKRVKSAARSRAARYLIQKRARLRDNLESAKERTRSEIQQEAIALYQQVARQSHQDCLELTLKVAENILKMEVIESKRESISSRLQDALNQLAITQRVSEVTLNSFDLQETADLLEAIPGRDFKLKSSDEIPGGQIQLTTTSGKIFLDWQQEFKDLAAAILRNFQKRLQGEL